MLYSPVYILHDSYIGKINHEKTPEFPFILVLRVNLSAQLFLTFNKIYMEIKNINIYNIYIYIYYTWFYFQRSHHLLPAAFAWHMRKKGGTTQDLISETVAYCYRALVRDSSCPLLRIILNPLNCNSLVIDCATRTIDEAAPMAVANYWPFAPLAKVS